MDVITKQQIEQAGTYREKAMLYLLLAFDDDNDSCIKHIYENMLLVSNKEGEE